MVKNGLRKKAEAVAMEEEESYSHDDESGDDGSDGSSDGGELFFLACGVWLACAWLLWMRRSIWIAWLSRA